MGHDWAGSGLLAHGLHKLGGVCGVPNRTPHSISAVGRYSGGLRIGRRRRRSTGNGIFTVRSSSQGSQKLVPRHDHGARKAGIASYSKKIATRAAFQIAFSGSTMTRLLLLAPRTVAATHSVYRLAT